MPDLNSLPPSKPASAVPSPSASGTDLRALHADIATTAASLPTVPSTSPGNPASPIMTTSPLMTVSMPPTQQASQPSPSTNAQSQHHSSLSTPHRPATYRAPSSTNSPIEPTRHHHRAPSLGELHQELENEQEAQVNRLLAQIRTQQNQLLEMERRAEREQAGNATQTTQAPQQQPATHSQHITAPIPSPISTTAAISQSYSQTMPPPGSSTIPIRSRTPSASRVTRTHPPTLQSRPSQSPILRGQHSPAAIPSTPSAVSRQSSHASHRQHHYPRRDSQVISLGESASEGRDEVALAQAEAANILRENQMLKGRIRELEAELQRNRGGIGDGEGSVGGAGGVGGGASSMGGERASNL